MSYDRLASLQTAVHGKKKRLWDMLPLLAASWTTLTTDAPGVPEGRCQKPALFYT